GGGILWALVIGTLGAAFGTQWRRLAHWIGRAGLLLALLVALVLAGAALRRRVQAGGGLTPFLRARFSPEGYLGLQLTIGLLLVLLAGAVFGGMALEVHRHG